MRSGGGSAVDIGFDELVDTYAEQATGLIDGGATRTFAGRLLFVPACFFVSKP